MSRSFDFVVNADKVVIKQKGKNKYKVKLAGVGDFLKYQTWSSTNANNINDDRSVSSVHVKNWVQNNFGSGLPPIASQESYLETLKKFGIVPPKPASEQPQQQVPEQQLSLSSFAPTTFMEVNNKKYIFVIENATYNKKKIYNTVFNVSTNQIVKNNVSKHLVKLPINKKLHKVRFDIDSSDTVSGSLVVSSLGPNSFVPFVLNFEYYPKNKSIVMNSNSFYASNTSSSVTSSGVEYWNTYSPSFLNCDASQSSQQCNFGAECDGNNFFNFNLCPSSAVYSPSSNTITVNVSDGLSFICK
jgi:hypothetical protein